MEKETPLHVSIQSGKYKGKKLLLPSLESTRASKSVLKSSYFNTIQFEIGDKIFIEAFGGSGSIGLEALSKGAKKAYFIEQNKNAFATLEKNCKNIAYNDTICLNGDTFIELPKLLKNINEPTFLYIDPPFDFRDQMSDIYKNMFKLIENISNRNIKLITIEHFSKLQIPNFIGNFNYEKTKKFGKSSLSFLRAKE